MQSINIFSLLSNVFNMSIQKKNNEQSKGGRVGGKVGGKTDPPLKRFPKKLVKYTKKDTTLRSFCKIIDTHGF